MIVSHRHRFIFLRTEKTGGSSLSAALGAILAPGDDMARMARPWWARFSPIHHGALKRTWPTLFGPHVHATAAQARAVLGRDVFDGYHKFAVERNPWDRQVSLYFHREWKKRSAKPDFDRDMKSFRYRNTEYVRLNNWSIYAIGDEIVADTMLRYESLAEDLAALCGKIGLPALELPRKRSEYRTERPHYSTYYSDWTRDLVGRWYAREIDAFGYRFETPTRAAAPQTAAAQ